MHYLDSLILAFALNVDSAILGMSIGLLGPHRDSRFALKWALYFGGFQGTLFLMGFFSFSALAFLHPFSHLIAGSVFTFLGLKLLISVIKHQEESVNLPESLWSSVLFSLSISVDAFFSSIAGVQQELVSVIETSFLIGAVGFVLTFLCTCFAGMVKKTHRKGFLLVGSFLLIFLGVKSFL